jgi:hypothetical protein
VFTAITEGLERANKHAVSNAQKVCSYAVYTKQVKNEEVNVYDFFLHVHVYNQCARKVWKTTQ